MNVLDGLRTSLKELGALVAIKPATNSAKLHTDAKLYLFIRCAAFTRAILQELYASQAGKDRNEVRAMDIKDVVRQLEMHKDRVQGFLVLFDCARVFMNDRMAFNPLQKQAYEERVNYISEFYEFMSDIVPSKKGRS